MQTEMSGRSHMERTAKLLFLRPALQADRDQMEPLDAHSVLRAGRSGIEIEKSWGLARDEKSKGSAPTARLAAGSVSGGGIS